MAAASTSTGRASPSASISTEYHTLPPLSDLFARSSKRARLLFHIDDEYDFGYFGDISALEPSKVHLASKISSEYADAKVLPSALLAQQQAAAGLPRPGAPNAASAGRPAKRRGDETQLSRLIDLLDGGSASVSGPVGPAAASSSQALSIRSNGTSATAGSSSSLTQSNAVALASHRGGSSGLLSQALIQKKEMANRKAMPAFHPNWKLSRVISGHLGWVRCVAVEPGNKWFATGASDRMIKIWDLASGELKLSLTGHISPVRGIAVSARHPYLFSAGEDKVVKCWDLETNRVIRQYRGHLSGIYSLALHPTLDVVVTGGRDATARVWDMRTRLAVHTLTGHRGTVASVACQDAEPQVISGSMDATVKLWDLAAGKSITTLTHHKKSVRALAVHPTQYTFASGSAGGNNIKTWRCPEGTLVNNMAHDTIVNTLSTNADGVLFSGGDDGSLKFFDYATGTPFQVAEDVPQPGSLDAEAGVFCSTFDQTGTRLITGGADKTIKVYKEV
ncbi:related to PRP46 - member of the spliceosome [Melanopsichium pennsylvanicum]|uniref:Pre-mRNA-splicing factor PRP46 n=2 Tax=Melanopsichium pennsylvanicum TaxID=63383 RepID=A0AAJ5C4L9_9BASI|nr:related to PRP46-member of the spliceosome [Melanopsichium pennsylvanicum 4]SNX83668.1 related to PRP46 - member of the spliceosome [Melanopsichium pennsylvanicum]